MVFPLFKYVLMAALRDRLFLSVAAILVIVSSLSVFFGASVITEQNQFSQTFAAFGLRLFGVMALALFVVSYIRRGFESRDIDFLLSRPVSRAGFVLTHALAFSFLGVLIAAAITATVGVFGSGSGLSGLLMWGMAIGLELVIVANVAMVFALVVSSPTACLLSFLAFYLLARLIGDILGILRHGTETGIMTVLAKIMEFISIFIPRFDMLGNTEWIVYGVNSTHSLAMVFAQCLVFLGLIICAGLIDLYRKQF